jgi:hypothetical protein
MVADKLGCSRQTVLKYCRKLGFGKHGRDYYLTEREVNLMVSEMKKARVGNPDFGPGFWENKKPGR